MLGSAVAGFLVGLSLIVAIGAQNAYVLRQGALRSHVGPVVAVCAASDLILIAAGVAGVGTVVDRAGVLLDVVRWFGVAFLLWYAAGALRRAANASALFAADGHQAEPRRAVIGRAVALTWLNPHVYLDTVLLLGSIAAAHDQGAGGRWWFAAGAGVASIVWFVGLGFGAAIGAPLLRSPSVWRMVETLIATTMIVVAVRLAGG